MEGARQDGHRHECGVPSTAEEVGGCRGHGGESDGQRTRCFFLRLGKCAEREATAAAHESHSWEAWLLWPVDFMFPGRAAREEEDEESGGSLGDLPGTQAEWGWARLTLPMSLSWAGSPVVSPFSGDAMALCLSHSEAVLSACLSDEAGQG